MAHGGRREGAGRKKGSHDKFAVAAAEKAAADGIMPLDYMLTVLRDDTETSAVRMDAAKAAAPYVHAKLSAVTVEGTLDANLNHTEDEEAASRAERRIEGIVKRLTGSGQSVGAQPLPQ